MPTTPAAYSDVATRDEWLAARKKLLAREREVTHLRDAVNAERRRLPMVKVEKEYVFEGPDGDLRLIDLFEGRPQPHIDHFMWIDALDEVWPELHDGRRPTFTEKDRALPSAKGVTMAAVCARRTPDRPSRGSIPSGRSRGTPRVTTISATTTTSPWIRRAADRVELPFARRLARRRFRDDVLRGIGREPAFPAPRDEVFHTYSAFARGLDHLVPGYPFLDLTPYGRQEPGGLACGWAIRR